MMHWLAGARASYGFEPLGRHVLTYHKRLQPEQLPALLDTPHFHELIPATIRGTRWSSPATVLPASVDRAVACRCTLRLLARLITSGSHLGVFTDADRRVHRQARAMQADGPLHLSLALEPGSDPIAGSVQARGCSPREFVGWMELAAALEAAIDHGERAVRSASIPNDDR